MAFPHQACLTCKKRRIKCDTARPHCGRCNRADRRCIWSEPDRAGGLAFKDENAYAQGEARRPRKVSAKCPQAHTVTAIPAALCNSIDDHALNFWIRNWTDRPSDVPDIGREYLTYIPSYWEQSQVGSTLRLAVSAQSLLIFGRLHRTHIATTKAASYYAQTIRKAQCDIQNLANIDVDELVLATLLMTHYETSTYKEPNKVADFRSGISESHTGSHYWKHICHYLGTAGLLKSRSEGDVQRPQHLALYRAARRPMIRAAILRGMPVQNWLKDAAAFGEEGSTLQLDALMVRVAELRIKALQLLCTTTTTTTSDVAAEAFQSLLNESQELDLDLSAWSWNVTEDFHFSTVQLPSSDENTPPFCGSVAHKYRSYSHASVWNRYRAVRMIVNSLIVQIAGAFLGLNALAPDVSLASQTSLDMIHCLATEICQSLPYFFNYKYPAAENTLPKVLTPLSWPLTVAINIKAVPDTEKYWFRCTLQAIGTALGDGVLESIARRNDFKF